MLFCFIHRIIYFHKGEEQAGPKPLRGEEEVAASGGDGDAGKKEFFRGRVERGRIEPYIPYRFFPGAEVGRFYAADRWLGFCVHCRDPQGRISASSSPRCCHRCGHRRFLFVYIVQLRGRGAVGGPKPLQGEEEVRMHDSKCMSAGQGRRQALV